MKHIGNELYQIIEDRKLVKRQIAKQIGMDVSQFSQLMKRPTIDCGRLEDICKAINISPAYFFDDWQGEKYQIGEIHNSAILGDAHIGVGEFAGRTQALLNEKDEKISLMQNLIDEKERLLQEKERLIGMLLDNLNTESKSS